MRGSVGAGMDLVRGAFARFLPAGTLRARLAHGALWSGAASVITNSLAFVAAIATARILGKVGYGELGVVNSTLGTFGVLAGLGLTQTAIKSIAQYKGNNPARAGAILSVALTSGYISSAVVAAASFLAAPWLSASMLNAEHLALCVRVGSVFVFFSAINGVQTGVLIGLEAFRDLARVALVRGLVSVPLAIGGTVWLGVPGAIAANALGVAVACVVNGQLVRVRAAEKGIPVSWRCQRSELAVLWNTSLPALLSQMVVMPVTWIATTMLARQAGGYGEMGLFNAANQWRTFIMLVPAAIAPAGLPALADMHEQRDRARYLRALSMNFATTAGAACLVAFPVMLFAGPILRLYGPQFDAGRAALVALAVTGILTAVGSVGANVVYSSGAFWTGFAMNILWAVVFLSATHVLVARGAVGLALAYVISYVGHTAITFGFVAFSLRSTFSRRVAPGAS